jgi:hypothetical protein
MGLLTTLFLAGYKSAGKDSDLRMSAGELMNNIRLAQSNTLGAVEYEGEVPEGGWGVYAEQGEDSYVIYADINEDFSYDEAAEKWRTVDLPEDIFISSIESESAGATSSVDITFEPPDPITYINGNDRDKVDIVIKDDRDRSKKIRINFFGLIEVVE